MKLGPSFSVIGLVALGALSLLAIRFIDTRSPATSPSPSSLSLTPTPLPSVWQPSAFSAGTVAVQTFRYSSLAASGTGTIVSSDGLILTTAGAAPFNSSAYVYQVATADGAVLRARSVWRASGLVLLKVEATQLGTVLFDESIVFQAGAHVAAVGAFIHLSRYVPVVVPATMPYLTDDHRIILSLDRNLLPQLIGSRVIDTVGRSVGVVQILNGGAYMLSATEVNDFVEKYLASIQKN